MRSGAVPRWLPAAVAWVQALVVLGPALGPGVVIAYDMPWSPDARWTPFVLGQDTPAPRVVPSDAVMVLLGKVLGAGLAQSLVLVAILVGLALGAVALLEEIAPHVGLAGQVRVRYRRCLESLRLRTARDRPVGRRPRAGRPSVGTSCRVADSARQERRVCRRAGCVRRGSRRGELRPHRRGRGRPPPPGGACVRDALPAAATARRGGGHDSWESRPSGWCRPWSTRCPCPAPVPMPSAHAPTRPSVCGAPCSVAAASGTPPHTRRPGPSPSSRCWPRLLALVAVACLVAELRRGHRWLLAVPILVGVGVVVPECGAVRSVTRGRGWSRACPGGGALRDSQKLLAIWVLALALGVGLLVDRLVRALPRSLIGSGGRGSHGTRRVCCHPRWRGG